MSGDVAPAPVGPTVDGADPFVRWQKLNRLVSQLQLTHETTGHLIERLAAEVEALRPEVGE